MNTPERAAEQTRFNEPPALAEREAAALEDAMFEAEERAYGLNPADDTPGVPDADIAQLLAEGRDASPRVDEPTDQAIEDAYRAVSELRTERETFERWADEARRHHERAQQQQETDRAAEADHCRELG